MRVQMKKARVLFKDSFVGILERNGNGSRFTYNEGWTQQIACVLPTHNKYHEWNEGLHPFFDNLSSEGNLQRKQAKKAHVDKSDTLGLLSRFGQDCMGAISLEALDPHNSTDSEDNRLPALEVNKTVSGVQAKALAYIQGDRYVVSTANDPATHIAKINSGGLEKIVWNEAITLSLAQEVLGKERVVEFKHTELVGEPTLALVVKRFDRNDMGQKLRMEDFAQILNIKRADKYKASYEDIAIGIDKYSARPAIDKMRFFELVVFNCMVGNTDAHLKNFALYETAQGELRLSPAYDLVNAYLYVPDGYDHRKLALRINNEIIELEKVNHQTLQSFGLRIGLEQKYIERSIERLVSSLLKSKKFIELSGTHIEPDDFRYKYKTIVEESCQRILQG